MRDTLKQVDQLVQDTKTIHEFYPLHTTSIKAIGVKNFDIIVPSTQFSTGEMLMSAKLSLLSFIYELCETFMFPIKKSRAIYDMYCIDYVYIYQILTDTESTSLQFVIFSKDNSIVPENFFRDIIFLAIVSSKILDRFDVSHEF